MIELLNAIADKWFGWELTIAWQAAVLIAIVWVIDLAIRKWAWPQVRYALWMLVLVKLILPPTLTSPASFTAEIPILAQRAAQLQSNQPQAIPEIIEVSEPAASAGETVSRDTVGHYTEASDEPLGATLTATSTSTSALSAPAAVSLSWKAYAFIVWLLGIAILSAWLIMRLAGLRREHLKGDPRAELPEKFKELLASTAERLGLKKVPQVILTNKVCCPAVFGVFRPVLLMPAGKLENLSMADTEHILLHELAHIKRGDLVIHAVHMILQIVYWFNPLLWMIRKRLQNLRELCCDGTVARLLREKTPQYRETLLETARQLLAEPVDPGLGLLGLFENSNWLVERLKWLEKKTWKNRPIRILTIFVLVCVMSATVLPMAKFDPGPPGFVIKGTVADAETGQPIAGAKVGDNKEYNDGKFCTVTDSNGHYEYKTWYEEHFTECEAAGYKTGKQILLAKLFGGEKEKVIDFALTPQAAEQSEFVATLPNGVTDKDVGDLLIERRDILQKMLQNIERRSNSGLASRGQVNQAKIDLLRVESKLAETPQKRIEILEQIVVLYKEQEKTTQLFLDTGRASQDELSKIKLQRLDAEVELVKAKTQSSNFTVTLDNGVTVELLGVCEHPSEGKQWWTPDGSNKVEAMYDNCGSKAHSNQGQLSWEMALLLSGPAGAVSDTHVSYKIPSASSRSTGNVTKNGQSIPNIWATAFTCSRDLEMIHPQVGLDYGPWKLVSTHSAHNSGMETGGAVTWFTPAEKDGKTHVTLTYNRTEKAIRVIGIGKDGVVHIAGTRTSRKNDRIDIEAYFRIPLKEMSEFRLMERPFHWITFKNVSLRPGVKTKVKAEPPAVQVEAEKPEKMEVPLSERQMQAVVPVIKSLAEALDGIASKYPELSEYQKEKVIQESDGRYSTYGWVGLSYQHNYTAPKSKRAVRPSDFGKNGFYINFWCAPIPPAGAPVYAMAPPTQTLRNLGLYLWAEVKTGLNPSPGIVNETTLLIKAHSEKLEEIDMKVEKPALQVEGEKVKS